MQGPVHRNPASVGDVFDFFDRDPANVAGTVTDLLISEELTQVYYSALGSLETLLSGASLNERSVMTRGGLLFFVLHKLISTPPREINVALTNRIAAHPDFLLFFRAFYEIPDAIGLRVLGFHAIGTTSIIFKALTSSYGQCALKVIQAPYARVTSIRAATASYYASYGLYTKHSPLVHESADLWIFMQFIEGKNLSDYLDQLRQETAFLSDTYLSCAATLFHEITKALSYYESLQPPIVHGDLTPLNIIVEGDVPRPSSIKLIDFGQNYVLRDRLGTRRAFAEAFSRTELFTAPEVLSGSHEISLKSDVYSLGMIGLELLSFEALRRETVGVRLREIWQSPASVGVAQIVEDLIDNDPENRLLMLPASGHGGVYSALDQVVQDQVNLYRDLTVNAEFSLSNQASAAFRPDVWRSLANIARIFKASGNPYHNVTKTQLIAARVNAFAQALIVSFFVLYTTVDAIMYFRPHWAESLDLVLMVLNDLPKRLTVGDLWGNLPGRAVAVSFGLIASRYYANIYATLSIRGVRTAAERAVNVVLRANCFSYFIPIMIAIAVEPHWWPFCAFVGVMFPAINNALCWEAAKLGANRSRALFSVETFYRSETERFLRVYKEWWMLMAAYGISIGLLGVFLYIGWAQDEAIYAYAVVALNMLKIYRFNCGAEAPGVLGNLSRLFFAVQRASEKLRLSQVGHAVSESGDYLYRLRHR